MASVLLTMRQLIAGTCLLGLLLLAPAPVTAEDPIMNLLTGLLVPVSWFPGWLRTLADATPFPSMFQTPIDVVMGLAGLEAIGVQAVWLVALVGVAQLMLHRGTRKLVIHGG